MKKLKLFLSFLLLTIIYVPVLNAQNVEERDVDPFKKIRVSRAVDVYLKAGEKEQVRIETKGIPASEVLTEVSGNVLKISDDHGRNRNAEIRVYVTYVSVDAISASSASGVYSEGTMKGENLRINVSSAADVELNVDMQKIHASVSSSGDLELKGRVEDLNIDASSAGGVDAFDLQANTVKVAASSAGSAKVTAIKQLDGRASSGANIRYRGNPERSQTDSSSGGSVKKSE